VIAAELIEGLTIAHLITPEPYLAYAKIAQLFFQKPYKPQGLSQSAIVPSTARIGKDVSIFPLVYIGENVIIGDRVTLYPGVYIGDDAVVGNDVIFYPHVTVEAGSIIGNRVILHPGVIIGGDGFGYAKDKEKYIKIPQVGTVHIEDDVEIGANSTVDRAAFGKTLIRRGTKIDNLVMVAHNVVIGEDTIIVAQSGIAGSSEIGNRVVIAAQCGVSGHINIGDNVTITARGGVPNSIPPHSVVSGTPTIPHRTWLKASAVFSHLPEMREELRALKKKVETLEGQLQKRGITDVRH
jgi:UDP-3-O-[3-hydroxymyristoyl] glucosamine N-acyltransferase